MAPTRSCNKIDISIDSLSKSELKEQIFDFKGRFEFDFTEEYLDGLSVSELKHILLAAMEVCK